MGAFLMSYTKLNRVKVINACDSVINNILIHRQEYLDNAIKTLVNSQEKNSGFPFYRNLKQKTYEDFKQLIMKSSWFDGDYRFIRILEEHKHAYSQQLNLATNLQELAKASNEEYFIIFKWQKYDLYY